MAATIKSADSKSIRSGGSHTSINVKLPNTGPDDQLTVRSPVHVQALSSGHATPVDAGGGERRSRPSAGTIAPSATPTREMINRKEVEKIVAARVIEKAWLSFRDHQMFRLLKHAICAAEHSLSQEILRKVCPKEANFLKDKAFQTKVRFRFGGTEFPPLIYFKVYTATGNGMGVKYLSGKRIIQPASEAARDACELMGHRKFYDQIIQDAVQQDTHKITGEVDVTTLKDYMQYMSHVDESPASMGGKDNSWRKLTLDVLPRQTIFYDVVDYLYHQRLTPRLQEELPALLMQPVNEDVQLQHIRIIAQLRSPPPPPLVTPASHPAKPTTGLTGRRSKQAQHRVNKMKALYDSEKKTPRDGKAQADVAEDKQEVDDDEWEEEANKLYEWTQELSFDDLATTPRLTSVAIH